MRRKIPLLALLALLAASPSGGWEPVASEVERRLARLDASLKSEHSARGKSLMAEQDPKPSWTGKTAWTETFGGKQYVFGVGEAKGIRNLALATAAAEDRARAQLLKIVGEPVRESHGQTTMSGQLSGARPVDWYRDPKTETIHALVVLSRPAPEKARIIVP